MAAPGSLLWRGDLLVAAWSISSNQRLQTLGPCTGEHSLSCWTTREVPRTFSSYRIETLCSLNNKHPPTSTHHQPPFFLNLINTPELFLFFFGCLGLCPTLLFGDILSFLLTLIIFIECPDILRIMYRIDDIFLQRGFNILSWAYPFDSAEAVSFCCPSLVLTESLILFVVV